ncbi:MAG: hypothetical protein ACJAYI_000348 [Myxococcota bacterium]
MSWLRTHKLLLVIYAAGMWLGISESNLSLETSAALEQPRTYIDGDDNVADISAAIYPGRAMTLYYQAYQAALCSQPTNAQAQVCKARGPVKPGEVRELIEQSLATGNRSIEFVLYNYAVVLVQEGAPADQIDAAVRNWRSANPISKLPDPRNAATK